MDNLQKLKALKNNRKDSIWFFMNFLTNSGPVLLLFEESLQHISEEHHQELLRCQVIRIVSCLETFYRDLFIYILEKEHSVLELALKGIKTKHTLAEVQQILLDGISTAELAVHNYSLQSVANIQKIMSLFFSCNDYLGYLHKYRPNFTFTLREHPSVYGDIKELVTLSGNWRDRLNLLFELRHEFIHDANSKTEISIEDIRDFQWLLFKMVHYTTFAISEKIETTMLIVSADDQTPVLFTPEDVLSNTWRIVPKGEPGGTYLKNNPNLIRQG
jgi:hypothetical protein